MRSRIAAALRALADRISPPVVHEYRVAGQVHAEEVLGVLAAGLAEAAGRRPGGGR